MSQRKNRTRLWFALHGWAALPVWVFLLFVCVTGTLATVDREIMWLIDPAARASNPAGLEPMPLNRLTELVQAQIPGAHVVEIEFSEPYMALAVTIATPDQPEALAWVNPYDGRVQRVATGITFSHFIRSMHGWLLMQWFDGTPLGWYAVTAMGLPMLVSVVTGLVVYKRFWRAITRPRLRLGQGSRLFWGDLHRLLAVWSLWFTVMIAVTGLWFMVRGIMWDMHVPLDVEPPDIPRREAPAARPAAGPDLDAALAAIQAASPGSRPRYLALPEHALGAVTVHSRSANPLLAEQAWVHPYDGTLLGLRDADLAPWHEAVSSVNASLHYGNFGGLWVKLIWTFFGIVLSTLVAGGTIIWFKRTARGPAVPEETP